MESFTVAQLIAKLQTMPQDQPVVILDWQKNEDGATEEGSSDGIYDEFEVHTVNDDKEEIAVDERDQYKPFIAISFTADKERGYQGDKHSQTE